MKDISTTTKQVVITSSLFIMSVLATCAISYLTYGLRFASIELFFCPLVLSFPIFLILITILRNKRRLGIIIPLLILPLFFSQCFFSLADDRKPENIFKLYLVDPIPEGVTNIQGRYLDEGLFEDVVITFTATPDALEEVIAKKEFVKESSFCSGPDKELAESSWSVNWVCYEKEYYSSTGGLVGYMNMWVDPEKSLVVIRRIV